MLLCKKIKIEVSQQDAEALEFMQAKVACAVKHLRISMRRLVKRIGLPPRNQQGELQD